MDKIKRHVFIKGAAMGARAFTWAASRSAHAAIFALSLRGAEQMAANWSTVAG